MVSMSEMMCVEMRMIFSCPKRSVRLRIITRCFGSNPAVGSSKINRDGFPSNACAIRSRCFMPPEKPPIFCAACSESSTCSKTSAIWSFASFRGMPLSADRYPRKSRAVILAYNSCCCGIKPKQAR